MHCNLYNPLLNSSMYKMRLLNNNFFGYFLIGRFCSFNHNNFRLLTVTMINLNNRFLNHNFYNLCYFMPLNHWLLNLNKLYLFLYNNMMHRLFYNLIFRLFVHTWYSLFNFKYFIYLSVDVFRNLFLNLNLFNLSCCCMVRYLDLSWDCLCCYYLMGYLYLSLFYYLDDCFMWYFYLNVRCYWYLSYYLLSYLLFNWIWNLFFCLYLYCFYYLIRTRFLFDKWFLLLPVYNNMWNIVLDNSFLLL